MDEPLANLDYKLREELRAELPKIFAQSGAIFVYATTEPSEALLLGGNTATLREGRVTQFGSTIEVYRRPADLVTARTFADPPLNVLEVVKQAGVFRGNGSADLSVPAHLADIADGPVTIAFHPHHLSLSPQTPNAPRLRARTLISEITGSESFVHLDFAGARWVMLSAGIHDIDPDAEIDVFLDSRHLMAFGGDGRAITMQMAA
jgi:glycerol transport system ATP-binding protein